MPLFSLKFYLVGQDILNYKGTTNFLFWVNDLPFIMFHIPVFLDEVIFPPLKISLFHISGIQEQLFRLNY